MEEIELITIRYLINNLIINQYEVNRKLDNITEILIGRNTNELKADKIVERPKPLSVDNDIKFDMFKLTDKQYQKLLDKYGLDIVSECCVVLDDFIKKNEYIPYGKPYLALDKYISNQVMTERIRQREETIKSIEKINIDYNSIETKEQALDFILTIPEHLVNVDSRVKELKDRFDL